MTSEIKSTILQAAAKMLRPLVRVLLKYQISYGEFASLLRRTYIEVADQDFAIPNRKSTYSKVAVMTGIDRKMVQEILNSKKDTFELSSKPINKGLSVVKTWTTVAKYLDKKKRPIDLPLRGPKSFETLAEEACADITPRALLDELIRVGVVERMDKQSVRLLKSTYIPSKDEEQLVSILFTCAKDLLVTGEHNIRKTDGMPWFQREVPYSEIPESIVEEFRQYSNEKSSELIDDVNRWLKSKKKSIKKSNIESTKRVGLGIYYIETDNNGD
ncbi:MAG: DUF6502 family protein [Gammaproteobacteria bacterium]|nr:DUF6502 family protein [Gammaproteobacteria bacterium]MDH5801961.1 DUF6502 family protein [Gammaproteobacteria bacterium]